MCAAKNAGLAAAAQILIVDPHEKYRVKHMLKESADKPEDLKVPVLADPAHLVSATYGVAFQMQIHTEWSNRPATFVIDAEGVLRFAHRGKKYSDRPSAEKILEVLEALDADGTKKTPPQGNADGN